MDNFDSVNPHDHVNDIAIVGLAGRFPGATNLDQYWQNLRDGVESIHFLTDEELQLGELDFEEVKDDPNYVRARGMLDDVDMFDAGFFGFTPRQAAILDPQQRIWFETAWEALENAGYAPEKFDGLIGVYAGGGYLDNYLLYNLARDRRWIEELVRFRSLDGFASMISNDKDYLPTRTSYLLNLRGPSINVQTACSTSLVAIIQASQSLLNYETDMCLAGAISLATPQERGYLYQEGGMYSKDGHCRTFDAEAQGTVFSSGLGIVVLKRFADAVRDGDKIEAIIKGGALNNDGALKVSFTAPSVTGQAEVIAMAQAIADVEPDTISYVEAHGTATPMGDPIEVEALTKAFRLKTDKKQFCGIGSVKSNLGHLDSAAGVAGLLKTLLAMQNKQIPPSLNYHNPNPQIDFENSPFYVVDKLTPWETENGTPRRAGISSFGIGGTNAHIILEETPESAMSPSSTSRPWQLFQLSAKTPTALQTQLDNLAQHLQNNPDLSLPDAAYTLQVGRADMAHRATFVCATAEEAMALIQKRDKQRLALTETSHSNPPVVFMFPGQGAQHVNMGRELYEQEPVFRQHIDECADILQPILDVDIRQIMYPSAEQTATATQKLKQTGLTQPVLFAIEYALAQLWQSWGIMPSAMIGHSVGEYVAACLAGVFTVADALYILAHRARLMQSMPSGSMRAIRLTAVELQPYLGAGVALAAQNAPQICVVSGPHEAIAALDKRLDEEGIGSFELHTSHAFHSEMMEPILAPFAEIVANVTRQEPQIPIVSTLTGTWLTAEEAQDPHYWAGQLRHTVRFSEAMQTLMQDPSRVYLEVGPSHNLTSAAQQHGRELTVIPSQGHARANEPAQKSMLEALGHLWLAGVTADWTAFYERESRRRIALPTYPFERQRYWVDPPPLPADEDDDDLITMATPPTAVVSPPPVTANGHMSHSQQQQAQPQPATAEENTAVPATQTITYSNDAVERLIQKQLHVMAQQLNVWRNNS